jgi:hypothetical protein
MQEAMMGYPLHAWLAVGHLEQAESELLNEFPDEAEFIRKHRVSYIDNLLFTYNDKKEILLAVAYHIDTLEMIRRLTICRIEADLPKPSKKKK